MKERALRNARLRAELIDRRRPVAFGADYR